MQKSLTTLLVALFLVGLCDIRSDSNAMMQHLSPEQRDDAIKYGKRGVRKEVEEFIKEWSVDKGSMGSAFITTEFLALAYAARQAALQSADLNSFDIEDTLAKSSGKLVFRVTLYGNTDNFAKDYTAVLQVGGNILPSTFWSNPPGEPYGDGKTKPAFVTDSDYFFPAEGIDPNASVTLVVQNKDGKEVMKFPFNFAALR
ncbi:MAG: hypothetical protein HY204_08485 [Nitrospirae bacterium]|nr:hypothetical protein [Nitrospirota bacterium]